MRSRHFARVTAIGVALALTALLVASPRGPRVSAQSLAGQQTDPLQAALLTTADLGPGWQQMQTSGSGSTSDLSCNGQSLGSTPANDVQAEFVQPQAQEIAADEVSLYPSVVAVQTDLDQTLAAIANCAAWVQTNADGSTLNWTFTPLDLGATYGDESAAFTVVISGGAQPASGDLVLFRRGDYGSTVGLLTVGAGGVDPTQMAKPGQHGRQQASKRRERIVAGTGA